jgi:hypothetical protein
MDAVTRLIPSGYKSKIPSTLSWPLGAEEISAALASVPQYGDLTLNFRYVGSDRGAVQSPWWMTVIQIDYAKHSIGFSASKSMIDRGWHERHWNLRIVPVLRTDRKIVRDRLLLQLPHVADWLTKNHALKAIGRSSLLVVWDKQKDTIYTSIESSLEPERILRPVPQPE